jgi:hypothetical protein
MRRSDGPNEKKTLPSRRAFLLVGGAVVTTFSLPRVQEAQTVHGRPGEDSARRIREIMKKYGSELGSARLVVE